MIASVLHPFKVLFLSLANNIKQIFISSKTKYNQLKATTIGIFYIFVGKLVNFKKLIGTQLTHMKLMTKTAVQQKWNNLKAIKQFYILAMKQRWNNLKALFTFYKALMKARIIELKQKASQFNQRNMVSSRGK